MPAKLHSRGQTYIEMIILIGILSILFAAIYTLISSSYIILTFIKTRTVALHLATDKIEELRNLPYSELGTVGGIPAGLLPQETQLITGGINFTVKLNISYIDDPFDQIVPNDPDPTDYKRLRVEVSWEGTAPSNRNPVILITDISPASQENSPQGGTLLINVFNANGIPVPQANVYITASTTPVVNLSVQSNSNGQVILPGSPVCQQCYQITVTKEGYSTDRTYSSSEVANPIKPRASIIDQRLTEIGFAIDETSALSINTTFGEETDFAPRPGVGFTLRGEKIIGTTTQGEPVYKFSSSYQTDGSGAITIENLEWDKYIFTQSSPNLVISANNPLIPIILDPDSSVLSKIALSTQSDNYFFGTFTDPSGIQIATVTATLRDNLNYDESKVTGSDQQPNYGQVFFPDLEAKSYDLTATASGYNDLNTSINVSGATSDNFVLNKP